MEFSHIDAKGQARMVDISAKTATKRTAIARAVVELNKNTMNALKSRALPKGDVFTVAQLAGIMAAKRTWELIPLCHPLTLSHVDVRFSIQDNRVIIEALASTTERTGVEMEALFAVQTAAATIYDMTKAMQKDAVIRDVRIILKTGGKSGLFQSDSPLLFNVEEAPLPCPRPAPEAWTEEGLAVACITLSDKAYAGLRQDESGPGLLAMLKALNPAKTQGFLLPDDPRALAKLVKELAAMRWNLILTTGGTGISPRDLTPEALLPLLDRRLPGFEQLMFSKGLAYTPRAVLSRCLAGTVGTALLLALPGSLRGAVENLSALLPVLPHALEKLKGEMSDCGRA